MDYTHLASEQNYCDHLTTHYSVKSITTYVQCHKINIYINCILWGSKEHLARGKTENNNSCEGTALEPKSKKHNNNKAKNPNHHKNIRYSQLVAVHF